MASTDVHKAWSHIFTLSSLRRLDLASIPIMSETLPDLLSPLRSLHLSDVYLREQLLIGLVHSCNQLENLALDQCGIDIDGHHQADIDLSPPRHLKNLYLRDLELWDDYVQTASWRRSSWLASGPELARLCICSDSEEVDIGQAWPTLRLPKLQRFDFVTNPGTDQNGGVREVRWTFGPCCSSGLTAVLSFSSCSNYAPREM